jgi:hypothetical protein
MRKKAARLYSLAAWEATELVYSVVGKRLGRKQP